MEEERKNLRNPVDAPISIGSTNVTPSSVSTPNFLRTDVTLTDGATVDLDANTGGFFDLVALGDRMINIPTNPQVGKRLIIRHKASGADRTLSVNTNANGFRFGTDITGLTATTSGTTDYIGVIWNEDDGFWDIVAYSKGY